ncbi:MAG: hypothetical protein ChlgKO_02980 [Chlamydiales bacterium]
MRYEIDRDQNHFYEENGFLEFENVKELHLAQIASTLTHEPAIRLAFTWNIAAESPFPAGEKKLEAISSINPILGAAIIFADKTLFLSPKHAYNFSELSNCKVIGYTTRKAVVNFSKNDPFSGELKKQAYGSGDRLKNETHPIIFST